jgi:hypothetical protein
MAHQQERQKIATSVSQLGRHTAHNGSKEPMGLPVGTRQQVSESAQDNTEMAGLREPSADPMPAARQTTSQPAS